MKIKNDKPVIIGALSQEEINSLKAKYPQGVFAIEVIDDEGKTHITYVKKPDIEALQVASKYAQTDPVKSGLLMFNTCRLGGSDFIVNDDESKLGVIAELGKLFKAKEATVKKL